MQPVEKPFSPSSQKARARAFELIQRFGWNATAFQTLEAGYRYFFDGDEACVAYVDTGRAWVAAGAPIAAPECVAAAAGAFRDAARAARRRCCMFATEERFRALAGASFRSFVIGEQPVWDPQAWPDTLAQHKSLREQLRRARAKGVRVRLLSAESLAAAPVRDALLGLAGRWFATRGMAAMSFLVHLELTHPAVRRCFVAESGGALVGFAGVIPVPARGGWFIEDLVRDPKAPNGTTELMVDAVMGWAAANGCDWLTLGLSPLAGEVSAPLELTRKVTKRLYDFDGLRLFKAKFRPKAWSPIYLSYPAGQSSFATMLDALRAFAPGGFVRFGLRSFFRGPPLVLGTLAALLLPWTLLLALAPTEHWFHGPLVKWAWVVFDLALFAGLVRGLARPSTKLLTMLATAVTLDAIATCIQALIWNVYTARGWIELVVVAIACAMPALAAGVLWGARRRSQRLAAGAPQLDGLV